MPKPRCPICNATKIDKPWAALAKEPGVYGPNLIAIGRARHGLTALDAIGRRPMPDDDGVLRCITCLQAWNGCRGPLVTGNELMCCGQAWVPKQATREAVIPVAAKVRPPTLRAEVLRKAAMEVARASTESSRLVVTLLTEHGIEELQDDWVFLGDGIDIDATVSALVQKAVVEGLSLPEDESSPT